MNPTRQDSFSLVTLEAIKSGNAILTTDLYAIPEMVKEDFNGYLINPKYRFFTYDNMPNPEVWNNRKETIYSDYIDDNIVDFLVSKIIYLFNNRDILHELSDNSYNISNDKFSEKNIISEWYKIFNEFKR